MPAGDRNKKGKPTDMVRHYGLEKNPFKDYLMPICGNKRAGYVTDDVSDVTCERCMAGLLNAACKFSEMTRGLFPNPNK